MWLLYIHPNKLDYIEGSMFYGLDRAKTDFWNHQAAVCDFFTTVIKLSLPLVESVLLCWAGQCS